VNIPEDLRYTAEHEWVRVEPNGIARVGITDFAQDSLGDIVYVQLPAIGSKVSAGEVLGEVESTKSVSEIYAPLTGEVTARNEGVEASPEIINSDPYEDGWLVEIQLTDPSEIDNLLSPAAYAELTQS
jgi:glycine cleavage system H protein